MSSSDTSAANLLATVCLIDGLSGDVDLDLSEAPPLALPLLTAKVVRLAPRMPSKDRPLFEAAFMRVWSKLDACGVAQTSYYPVHETTPEDEMVLMRWIGVIVARRTPVASASRRRITDGETVAYPEELEVMKRNPSYFGGYRLTGLRDDWFSPLQLTHRQLALHVEFAPLLGAILVASRLPRNLINGKLMPAQGMRPQLVCLLEVLLARRPDNMTDERFLPCVRWLLSPRQPLWPDFDQHIIG